MNVHIPISSSLLFDPSSLCLLLTYILSVIPTFTFPLPFLCPPPHLSLLPFFLPSLPPSLSPASVQSMQEWMAVIDATIQGVPEQAYRRKQTISRKYSGGKNVYLCVL